MNASLHVHRSALILALTVIMMSLLNVCIRIDCSRVGEEERGTGLTTKEDLRHKMRKSLEEESEINVTERDPNLIISIKFLVH